MTEDGSIVINTKIRTDGIKAGSQEIEAGLRRAANRVDNLGTSAKNAINKQIDAFAKLNNEYIAQEQKVESLRQKVESYANQRIPTAEYKKIQDEIETTTAKMNQLICYCFHYSFFKCTHNSFLSPWPSIHLYLQVPSH